MSDARAMLRAAREAKRIQHPHATYSAGKLSCTLCRIPVKSDQLWDSHIRSTPHVDLLKKMRNETTLTSRKRKADDEEPIQAEDYKRSKVKTALDTSDAPAVSVQGQQDEAQTNTQEPTAVNGEHKDDVDQDEWARFEQEMQQLDENATKPKPAAGTTISAAPLNAEELAAQAREAESKQRSLRDAEDAAERDDANDRVQDEFEEMERLQDRMRALRDKREALRHKNQQQAEAQASHTDMATGGGDGDGDGAAKQDSEESGSDSESDEDEDEWASLTLRRG